LLDLELLVLQALLELLVLLELVLRVQEGHLHH
jgi:hypothetical protein